MKFRNLFLLLGILFSAASKFIQFSTGTLLGDLLILPAGTFFVLAILFSLSRFQKAFHNSKTKYKAILLAVLSSLTVLCFQLFTMLAFGYGNPAGYLFILPVLIFAVWSSLLVKQLNLIP